MLKSGGYHSPNGRDCKGRAYPSGGRGGVAGCRRWHVVEDSGAAVARVQAVVAADFVEDLGPQTHMADRAQSVACLRDRDALTPMSHAFEERQHLARQGRHHFASRGGELDQLLLDLTALGLEHL